MFNEITITRGDDCWLATIDDLGTFPLPFCDTVPAFTVIEDLQTRNPNATIEVK